MKVESGNTISVHYRGTLDSGEEFDSSHGREEPLVFEVGSNMVIPGFEDATIGMEVGETKTVSLTPDQGYGEAIEERVHVVPRAELPEEFVVTEGAVIQAQNETGTFMGIVGAYTDDDVTVDFNHPLAGKNLNFEIELINIEED